MIRAEIIGNDRAGACGIVAKSRTPVLRLCRLLIEAGYDPATPLQAYRKDTLCLHVRSIGEAAGLTVSDPPSGGPPTFAKWDDVGGRLNA